MQHFSICDKLLHLRITIGRDEMALRLLVAILFGLLVFSANVKPITGQESDMYPEIEEQAIQFIGARCTFCHSAPLMLALSRRMLDQGGPYAFLLEHHAPDNEARAAIVQFLSPPTFAPDQRLQFEYRENNSATAF